MMRGIFAKRSKSKDQGDENLNESFSNTSELLTAEAPASRGSRAWGRRSKGGKDGTQEEASAATSTNSLSRSQQQLQANDPERRMEEDQPPASKPLGGMSAEEKFMAYYQQKQTQKVAAPAPAPPPPASGDHLAMVEEEERQRAVLKEQQQQQALAQQALAQQALAQQRALEQQQAQQLARQQQARQQQEAMRQQQAQQEALGQQQATRAAASPKQSEPPEDGMSVEDARKERARQAVEDRKRKAREAVEARKAKARQAALDKAGGNNGSSDDGEAQQAKARAEQEQRETEQANRKAEEARLEKQRHQEEARLARESEAARMAQEEALAAERVRQEAEARQAEQARMEQESRAAQMAQQESEARLQEESRQQEQARIAHEQKLEQRRKQEEGQWQEEQRLRAIAEEKRKAEEARLAIERFADQQRQAEEAEASRRQQKEAEAVAQAGREAMAELQRLEAEEAAELEELEAEEAAAAAAAAQGKDYDDDGYDDRRNSLEFSEAQEEAATDPRSLVSTKSEDIALDGELSALLDESALFDAVLDEDVPQPPQNKVTKPKKEEPKKGGGLRFYRPMGGSKTSSSHDSDDPGPIVNETPSPKEKSVPARTPLTTPRKLNSQLEAGATTPLRKFVVTGSPAKFSNGRHKRSMKSPRNQPVSPARSYASTGSSVEIDHLPRSPLRPVPLEESVGPVCDHEYIAKLHKTRGPCSVCLYHLSDTERAEHDKNGRHYRVISTFGGCLDCEVFPNDEGEEPVRLCKKCFFDTHKQHKRKEAAFESTNALAGIGSRSPK